MRTLLSQSAACPSSSKAITTTAAPCAFTMRAWRRNSSSPTWWEDRRWMGRWVRGWVENKTPLAFLTVSSKGRAQQQRRMELER